MASIFLSYAREDRRRTEQLARGLEAAGHEVWWDRHVHAGLRFSKEIDAALRRADLVVVLWSKSSVDSAWVQDEAAAGRDSSRLVPVLLDRVEPPLGFRQYQVVDLTGRRGDSTAIDRLVAAVAEKLGGAAAPQEKRPHLRLPQRPLWPATAALILIVAAAGIALEVLRSGSAEAGPASLAVLPFKNMSAGEPYFAEGVAEEISDQLAREPQFRVAGRTSAALFKDAADLRDVGRRLHVAYVLEGSVRSAGNEVRVNVALVDTRQGMQLWAQDFRGSLNDIFAIQDSIGQQVANHVRKELVREVLPGTMKTSGEVYSLYVTARSLLENREAGKIAAAVDLLKRAVKLDPNYAPAWAQLALAMQLDKYYGHADEPNYGPSPEQQLRVAEHAIALAPKLGEAHAVAGLFLLGNPAADADQIRRGRQELEQAVKLDPNDATAWYWLSDQRMIELDFDGALDAIRHTASIDPFFVFSERLPFLAWDMGSRDEAVQFLDNRIKNHPDLYIREWAQAQLALLHNDWSGAYRHVKAARDVAPPDARVDVESRMAPILANLGLFEEASRYAPAFYIEMKQGKVPSTMGEVLNKWSVHPLEFWLHDTEEPRLVPRILVNGGNSRALLILYDRAFSSPENMTQRYSKIEFVDLAPMLAIAMQQAGRMDEARRTLALADRLVDTAIHGGRTPLGIQVIYSRLWATLGRKELAVQTLQRAVAQGWRPADGEMQKVTDEPGYRSIRTDPRLLRIDEIIGSDVVRERRELLTAGV